MARDHGSDLDAATPPGTEAPRVAPGKRSPTDRLQRRAAAPPAGAAAPARWTDPTLSSTPFVDSLLAPPVQRHGGGGGGGDVHALAASGTAGAGHALPFLDQIQASFGDHDVGNVQAHTDGAAAAAATGMGATAFATGNHVAFGGAPDLHTAAHEAAHVVQQRAGVSLKGGVGEVGDPYEQHADAVADAVVRGDSAQALLDHGPQGNGGAAIQRRVTHGDPPDPPDTSKPEVELPKVLAKLSASMTAAEALMGKGGKEESDAIRTHATVAAAALSDAKYHAARLTKGGEAAKQAALVKRHEPAIDALYAWARKVRVHQATSALDVVFDRWDDLLFAVGLDKQVRAEKYYADWTVAPDEMSPERAKEGPATQHDLVEECVRMFEQAATITPLLAIAQFETMLSEPVAPPEPALLEKLLRLAGSVMVTYFGGKVAEELGAAITRWLSKGDDFKAKVVESIEGKVDTLAEKIKGEDDPGQADGGGGSPIRTAFLDKTRLAAFVAMQHGGAALTKQKHELLRSEPHQIAQLHTALRAMPPRLWAAAKQKVIFEWLNLKASFDRDHKTGKQSNQLDFRGGGRVGERGGQVLERLGRERGIYKQNIKFGDAHGLVLDVGSPQLEGMEDAVKRELVAAAVPMMKLPLHRRIMMTRRDHYHGTPRVIASVYLTADHQLVIEQMDNYVMAKIQRGESIDGPKNPGKPAGGVGPLGTLPDPMPKTEKEMADEAALTPSLYDTGTATLGVKKLLGLIKTTTADLGGGD